MCFIFWSQELLLHYSALSKGQKMFIYSLKCEWVGNRKESNWFARWVCFLLILLSSLLLFLFVMSLPQKPIRMHAFGGRGHKLQCLPFFSLLFLFYFWRFEFQCYVIWKIVSLDIKKVLNRDKPTPKNANIGRECVYDAISQLKFC